MRPGGRAADVRAMIASGAGVNAADGASQGQTAIARLLIAAGARVADIDRTGRPRRSGNGYASAAKECRGTLEPNTQTGDK
jgi:hypothetical protein